MELEELKAEIEDLHTKRQFSAIKTILNQLNPADIAQLLEEFSNEERLLFFPTGYKRSIQFGQEDPSGIVQRTAALNAVKNNDGGALALCTYPEALAEKVVGQQQLRESILTLRRGDRLSTAFVEEILTTNRFERVDFVYEPGQYSVRGGIIDIFSFSSNVPYRIDFFGDEIDSIRPFDISTQLSTGKLAEVEIVPNLKDIANASARVSFATFAGQAVYWIADGEYTLKRFNDIRTKILGDLENPSEIDRMVTSRKEFLENSGKATFILLNDNITERAADVRIAFNTSPQPQFNKNFELLAEDITRNRENGYETFFLTENKAQLERLGNIFNSIGAKQVRFGSVPLTLHAGFIDHISQKCFYTDHQIFDRYQRYRIRGELDRSESLTIQELNSLKVGDYVVHIDHGVGRFGGLTRTVENGKVHEAIKLVYRDNDVLLVNVHALHRISKYKDKESEPPKIYKLGSGAWQRMKLNTKKAVKDIARELIALYAKRKASEGFAYSPDSYLQHELEASFIYEDTPDQQTATQLVKQDMESRTPMDRLICGDVGFGKTEIAIRAAFKAVTDSKQAVLVPTTILALQHYRTFNDRLKEFPVRIEHLSRVKSAKEVRQIADDLAAGKIDILVGTHKLLGKSIEFKDLGLLIIDEEQKFGVAAKEKLRHLKANIDTLTMTATPIPRTLQFSLMGSRDLSVISTPPPNRQPIATESHLFDEEIIREAIGYELSRNGQVYFVHNRVETIGNIERLVRKLCPEARVGVGHGQMNPQQLEQLMMDFIYGEFDVLVATSIIESGVDVPNANTIIIDNAQNSMLLKTMISSWRKAFRNPEMPFVMIQLPRINDPSKIRAGWPEFREMQDAVAKTVPKVYSVNTIDLGSTNSDVHPPFKRPVGERAGNTALNKVYGKKIPCEGPALKAFKPSGSNILVQLDQAAGLTTTDGKEPAQFEIAGTDGTYHPAAAEIINRKGNTAVIRLSSPEVKPPNHARY